MNANVSASILVMLLIVLNATSLARAQSNNSKGGEPTPAAAGVEGFSIESEVLTYAALGRGGEAIAEDVVRVLSASPGERGVVIMLSNSPTLGKFESWRAQMASMNALIGRAKDIKEVPAEEQGGTTTQGGSPKVSPLNLTAAGTAVSLIQSIFARSETTSPVKGNVADETFAGSVARQLRAHGLSVLMPDTYSPYSHATARNQQYTILRGLRELEDYRAKVFGVLQELKEAKKGGSLDRARWTQVDIARAQTLLSDIDLFMASMLGAEAAGPPQAGETKGQASDTKGEETSQGTKSNQKNVVLPSTSHLASLLDADLFANELEVDPSGASLLPAGRWQHVLWLKAAESGGTLIRTEKYLTKDTQFTGGFIGAYALFNFRGELECSGTVAVYEGPISAKDLAARNSVPGLQKPAVSSGSCAPP